MADFLSDEWFGEQRARLEQSEPPVLDELGPYRVVFALSNGPAALPHALTLSVDAEGPSLEPGDHLGADAIVRLDYVDALALTIGTLTSAAALREGRLKVTGDVHRLVPLLGWLLASHRARA